MRVYTITIMYVLYPNKIINKIYMYKIILTLEYYNNQCINLATSDDIDTLLSDLDLGPDDLQEPGDLYQGQHDSFDLGSEDLHQSGSFKSLNIE